MTDDRECAIQTLKAARAAIDAALLLLSPSTGCRHPPEARKNLTVFGGPKRFFCKLCNQQITTDP